MCTADKEARAAAREGKLGHYGQQNTVPLDQELNVPAATEGTMGGFEVPGYRPPPQVPDSEIPGVGALPTPPPIAPNQGPRRMSPHLQLMTYPMLRYDTVKDCIYHAYCMIVIADNSSETSPVAPCLQLEWDATNDHVGFQHQMQNLSLSEQEKDEGVHRRAVSGEKIYSYIGLLGANSFWRFKIEVPLTNFEQEIFYSINSGVEYSWHVPALEQNMRWVAHSCNGFSGGIE